MNVGEARRDHTAYAELVQRIDGALARRAAAPVAVRDYDPRALKGFDIEQVFLLRAVGVEAPVVKQHVAILGSARHLVEARWAQLVGVDVRLVDRRRDAG